jgi:hypothetical protein
VLLLLLHLLQCSDLQPKAADQRWPLIELKGLIGLKPLAKAKSISINSRRMNINAYTK